MSDNILIMSIVLAVFLALLFLITGIVLLISAIVSKCHKNSIKPIRLSLMFVAFACSIISFAGYHALSDIQVERVYGDLESFNEMYDEEEETITFDGSKYVMTDEYSFIYGDENYPELGRFLLRDSALLSVGEEYVTVTLYDCSNNGFDLILSDYDYSIYCREDQYSEFVNYTNDISSIEYSVYTGDYYDDSYIEGTITDITTEIKSAMSEVREISSAAYEDDGLDGTVSISDTENITYVDLNTQSAEEYSGSYYELIVKDSQVYYIVDYNLGDYVYNDANDDYDYELSYECYQLTDESSQTIVEMMSSAIAGTENGESGENGGTELETESSESL